MAGLGIKPVTGQAVNVTITKVGTAEGPVGLVNRAHDDSLYVVEQRGIVRRLDDTKPLLDVRTQVSTDIEQGLLGLAFSNDGATAYIDLTNARFETEIRSYSFADGTFTKPKLLLKIAQPYSNHNGGQLVVDRDDTLWIAMGDGGGAGDPKGNGQNTRALLGKILRIDPHPAGVKPYGIPKGNASFAGGRPEIWAMGVRNPWRFSIDQETRTVWIADVGQNAYEEIDAVPADTPGANFGWNNREGLHPFDGGRRATSKLTDPVFDYPHAEGACSVTGGYVYRGKKIPSLVGGYVFADFCVGKLVSFRADRVSALNVRVKNPTSFGVDNNGELYVVSQAGPIYRIDPA